MYKAMDTEKNGLIAVDSFAGCLLLSGQYTELEIDVARIMLSRYYARGDGTLTFKEFAVIMSDVRSDSASQERRRLLTESILASQRLD